MKNSSVQPPEGPSAQQAPARYSPDAPPAGNAGGPAAQYRSAPVPTTWVTFSHLQGHPIITVSEGKRVGDVHDLLLDEHRRSIQAFVTKSGILHGPSWIPIMQARIGTDAVTFQPGALAGQDTSWLAALPKASELLGRRVLTETGRLLGAVADLRIDPGSGAVLAYEVQPEPTGILHRLGSGRRLLPTQQIMSHGPDAIIARDLPLAEL